MISNFTEKLLLCRIFNQKTLGLYYWTFDKMSGLLEKKLF